MRKFIIAILAALALTGSVSAQYRTLPYNKKQTKPQVFTVQYFHAGNFVDLAWTYPTYNLCPSTEKQLNCLLGFNLMDGSTIIATAGFGTGQLGPPTWSFHYQPATGLALSPHTYGLWAAGFDSAGTPMISPTVYQTITMTPNPVGGLNNLLAQLTGRPHGQ